MKTYTNTDILNIDYIDFEPNPILIVPTGVKEFREHGNPVEHNGDILWDTTAVKMKKKFDANGDELYPGEANSSGMVEVHSIYTFINWEFKTELKLLGQGGVERQGEDPFRYFDKTTNLWHLWVEDKTSEKKYGQFMLNHYTANNRLGPFYFLGGSSGLAPSGTSYMKYAVYSAVLKENGIDLFFGGRGMKGAPSTENPSYAKWDSTKYIPLSQPVMKAYDWGYQSLDWSDIFKVNDQYVAIISGLRNWSEANPDDCFWCNGIAVSNSKTSGWKVTKKILLNKAGEKVFAMFYYDEVAKEWKAIINTYKSRKFYLAKIITKGSVKPPTNGGDMNKPINLEFNKSTKTLSWGYGGGTVDKFDIVAEHNPPDNWIGHALSTDRYFTVPEQYIKEKTQFFQVVAIKDGDKEFSDKLLVTHNGTEPVPVGDNAQYVEAIKAELVKIDDSQSIIYSNLNKIKGE